MNVYTVTYKADRKTVRVVASSIASALKGAAGYLESFQGYAPTEEPSSIERGEAIHAVEDENA